jgi:hypothetical protein
MRGNEHPQRLSVGKAAPEGTLTSILVGEGEEVIGREGGIQRVMMR